jgi:hypothetical protein
MVINRCKYSGLINYRNSKELVKFSKNAQKSTKVKDRRETLMGFDDSRL